MLDYTASVPTTLNETEVNHLSYNYVYGHEKLSVQITGDLSGAGSRAKEDALKLYYHKDRLGTTDFLTDNISGKITAYSSKDEWGNLLKKQTLKMGMRELDLTYDYTGHEYDRVLGIYHAKARMYDASNRRFMSVDPVKGSVFNPATLLQYTYCLDNPLKYVDPLGMRHDEDYFNDRPSKSLKNTTNSGEHGSSLYIKVIQAKLVDAGYSVAIDGSYGPETIAAVKRYQRAYGLTVDGNAGPQTISRLDKTISYRQQHGEATTYVKNEVLPQVKATAPFKVSAPPIPSPYTYAGYLPEELFKNSAYFETPDCEKIVYEGGIRYKGGGKIISTYTQEQYELHQEMLDQGLEVDKKLGTVAFVLYGGHVLGAIGAVSSSAASAGSAFGSMVTTTENVIASPGGTAIIGNSVTNVQVTAEAQVFVTESAYAVAANGNAIIDAMTGMGGGGPETTSKTVDDILEGGVETTRIKGKARNIEKTGGFDQALDDFNSLNPSSSKDITTKYGDGKFGTLNDGTTLSVRPGSETGGPTLEIKVPGQKIIKIRY